MNLAFSAARAAFRNTAEAVGHADQAIELAAPERALHRVFDPDLQLLPAISALRLDIPARPLVDDLVLDATPEVPQPVEWDHGFRPLLANDLVAITRRDL